MQLVNFMTGECKMHPRFTEIQETTSTEDVRLRTLNVLHAVMDRTGRRRLGLELTQDRTDAPYLRASPGLRRQFSITKDPLLFFRVLLLSILVMLTVVIGNPTTGSRRDHGAVQGLRQPTVSIAFTARYAVVIVVASYHGSFVMLFIRTLLPLIFFVELFFQPFCRRYLQSDTAGYP